MAEAKASKENVSIGNSAKAAGNANALFNGIDRGNPETYYSYKDLKNLIKKSGLGGSGKGFEAHHLLEKNLQTYLLWIKMILFQCH